MQTCRGYGEILGSENPEIQIIQLNALNKKKGSKKEEDDKQEKETWKHPASKREVNALKAMMKKNAKNFKKKLDEQNEEDEK